MVTNTTVVIIIYYTVKDFTISLFTTVAPSSRLQGSQLSQSRTYLGLTSSWLMTTQRTGSVFSTGTLYLDFLLGSNLNYILPVMS